MKSKNKIAKIVCTVAIIATLLTLGAVNVLAYQTTNSEPATYFYYGTNTYYLAPVESMYYNWITESNGNTVTRSINAPNQLNLQTKRFFSYSGTPLNSGVNTETFGPLGEGATLYQSWDYFAENSDFLPQDDLVNYAYTKTGTPANEQTEYIYPFFKPEDMYGYTDTNSKGTNLDVVSYGIDCSITNGYNADLIIKLGEFTTTAIFSQFLCIFQASALDLTDANWRIDYSFEYADRNHVGNYEWNEYNGTIFTDMNSNKTDVIIDERNCERGSISLLDHILTYEEEVNESPIDRHSNNLIRWTNVQLTPSSPIAVQFEDFIFSSLCLRPYSQEAIDDVPVDYPNSSYLEPEYTDVHSKVNNIWARELFKSREVADITDIGPLGLSIGNAVSGFMQAEIFPGIDLWVLLIIPFALGLTFTFIKFFAGG